MLLWACTSQAPDCGHSDSTRRAAVCFTPEFHRARLCRGFVPSFARRIPPPVPRQRSLYFARQLDSQDHEITREMHAHTIICATMDV